ncbi:MAG TPA: hypothetical protein VHE79_03825 [Spirochaetia bacterium]
MVLFLLASLPLFFVMVVLLPWDGKHVPKTLGSVSTFLKGLILFFPGYLVILILRKIFGFSYDGFLYYLSLLLSDHLAPLVVALAGFLLLQRSLRITGTDESIFLAVFSFLCGFLSLVNLTDILRAWGSWGAYDLFLLPLMRIAAVLLLSLAAQRFFRWEGREAGQYLAVGAGLSVLLALASFLFGIARLAGSIVIVVLAVLGGVLVFALRFPRAVRG